MYYVYILNSISFSKKYYVGSTSNIDARLKTHNNGKSKYTKEFTPWRLVFSCNFIEKKKAMDFEKYLKSHSGRAFMNKRLI